MARGLKKPGEFKAGRMEAKGADRLFSLLPAVLGLKQVPGGGSSFGLGFGGALEGWEHGGALVLPALC